jgi:hypothetical protein
VEHKGKLVNNGFELDHLSKQTLSIAVHDGLLAACYSFDTMLEAPVHFGHA